MTTPGDKPRLQSKMKILDDNPDTNPKLNTQDIETTTLDDNLEENLDDDQDFNLDDNPEDNLDDNPEDNPR